MISLTDLNTRQNKDFLLIALDLFGDKEAKYIFFINKQFSCDSLRELEEILRSENIQFFEMNGLIFELINDV